MWYPLILPLMLSCCLTVNAECSAAKVVLRFEGHIVPNNSYILYNRIRTESQRRLYCHTDNWDCCNEHNSDWFFPNGRRVLGGFEYSNIRAGVFARSRGFRSLGLYRHNFPQDRGRFWCVLPDSYGNNCTLFANIVDEVPVIRVQPLSQTLRAGENVTFSTHVSNANFATYHWQKDKVDLIDRLGKYEGTTTLALRIFDAQEEDEGDYRCVIDSFLMSDTAELSIVSAPIVILHNMTKLTVSSGNDFDFSFYTDQHLINSSATFYWEKDGLNISTGKRYKGTATNTLTLLNVQSTDEGHYSLTIIMAKLNIISFSINISVVTFAVKVSTSVAPEIGQQCNLTCTISGAEYLDPTISYQWFKDGSIILSANESILMLQFLTDTDAGEYKCKVDVNSKYLTPSFAGNISNTYWLCFTLGISVTLAGSIINNNSIIYFEEIGKQDTYNLNTSALVCHTSNFNSSCETNSSQMYISGDWYFPNGEVVPLHTLTQTSLNLFTQRSPGRAELYQLGHATQAGHYFCTAQSTDKFYIYIRSHISLSLRGVTIYNNSHINIGDIGDRTDDEALQCHTDNINCCDSEHTENGSLLGDWYYPNGSRMLSEDVINDSQNNDSYLDTGGFFMRRSQSKIMLFTSRAAIESGHFCCKIPDQYGSNQTLNLCINIVSGYVNKTDLDIVCPSSENNTGPDTPNCDQSCTSSVEAENVAVQIFNDDQETADIGRSFSMNCTVGGIGDQDSLTITYQWLKDNHSLPEAQVPVLYFSALKLSDTGSYVCEVFIKSNSQGHGIIRSSLPYKLNISSVLFQIRLHRVQNCIQWTSSDAVTSRLEDIENIIISSLREHCQCEISRDTITSGGFQCFSGSENHITFRARLSGTNEKSSLELITYLEDFLVDTRSWLIHGQYLKLNLTCNLLITDIHSPECSQSTSTSDQPISYNDPTTSTEEAKLSCSVGYFIWALSSTAIALLLMAAFGILMLAKILRRKRANNTIPSSQVRVMSTTREIGTDVSSTYDKEADVEMKYVSMSVPSYEDDYEEICNISKKAEYN